MPSQTNVIILKAAVSYIPLRIYVTINWFVKVMSAVLSSHKIKFHVNDYAMALSFTKRNDSDLQLKMQLGKNVIFK